MIWQDAIIALSNITFSIALVPMIIKPGRYKISGSLVIAMGLWAKTGAMLDLGLLLGGITVGVAAGWWSVLFVKRVWEREKDKDD